MSDIFSDDLGWLRYFCWSFEVGHEVSLPEAKYRRSLTEAKFIAEVKEIASGYDTPVKAELLWRVERTVSKHFCAFWEECETRCRWSGRESEYRRELETRSPLVYGDPG
jgi:hypothetical protein